jgi:pimeloyl-ACP methyl ester carboxylesterase
MGLSGMMSMIVRRIALPGVTLNVAQAGPNDGPLLVLLHGFPEFHGEWRDYIAALAAQGFHVLAPDQRGYNLSDKPAGVDAYRLDQLANDILELADHFGAASFQVVGHDWGAAVAWWIATIAPQRLKRFVVLNAPHPAVWRHAMAHDPVQRKLSRYVQTLRLPWLPEFLIRAGGYSGLAKAFASCARPQAFSTDVLATYHSAWKQPGALTAMLNWYRALFRQDLPMPAPRSLAPPALVLWGDNDPYGRAVLAEQSAALCANARIVHFPAATHWIVHEESAAILKELSGFLEK